MIGFDPRAGLALRPFTVHLGGDRYHIRSASAAVWLEAWASGGVTGVLRAMLHDKAEQYRFYRALSKGEISLAEVHEASRRLFAAAAGCDEWWVADRLALQSVTWAGVGGELYTQGLRPDAVPLTVWLAVTYRVMILSVKAEERTVLEGSLQLPPDGYDTGEPAPLSEIFTP